MKKRIILSVMIFFVTAEWLLALDMKQIQIHGFVSQGYMKSDNNNYYFADTEDGTFEFNEIGINFMSDLSDQLRIGIQFFSKDLGEFGNNDIDIDWAYGDFRFRNWLGLRAGKIKVVLGLYNHIRDVDAARSCIFLPHGIYNEAFRDSTLAMTGLSLYGILPAGFEYEVQFGKRDIPSDGVIVTTMANGLKIPVDDVNIETVSNTVDFHLQWRLPKINGLKLVGTYLTNLEWDIITPQMTLTYDLNQFIASVEYSRNNLNLSAEYCRQSTESRRGNIQISDRTRESYYGILSYRFSDLFEAGTYYSVFYGDKNDKDGEIRQSEGRIKEGAWLKDLALFTRFDITQNWIVKLEGHYMDGLAEILDATESDLSDTGFLFAVKTTFSF